MGKANYIPEEEEEDTLFDLSTADRFQQLSTMVRHRSLKQSS